MTDSLYLISMSAFFIVNLAAALGLFFYKRQTEYLHFDESAEKQKIDYINWLQIAFFILGMAGLYVLAGKTSEYKTADNEIFGLMIFAFMAIGFVPQTHKIGKVITASLEFGTILSVAIFSPSPEFFSKFEWHEVVIKALFALIWFLVYKQLFFKGKNDGLTLMQSAMTGLTLLLAVYLTHFQPRALLLFGGLLLPVVLVPVALILTMHAEFKLNRPFANMLNICVTGLAYMLICHNAWACGVLLVAYPLFELVFTAYSALKNLIRRKFDAPNSFYEIMAAAGYSNAVVINFIMRRNFLFAAFVLLALDRPGIQPQIVVITILLFLKFAMNVSSPETARASFKDLYNQLKADTKKGWTETNEALSVIKDKYKDKD